MESEISKVVDHAVGQPGVTGYICVDSDGLCIAVKGDANESMSGLIHQIADLANKMEDPRNVEDGKKESPVIRVDLERQRLLIQSRESITTALITSQK